MANEYLDKVGLTYFWGKLKAYFQEKLVSGTNIKTVNNESLLGSGNITIEGGASIPYLTCADEASTVAKTTTLVSGTLPPTLEVGQQIVVKFDHYNSASSPTLEVGTYGVIPMTRYGTTTVGTDIKTSWHSGAVCSFTYDGTNWVLHSDFDENTTYSLVKSNTPGVVPAASSTHSVLRRTSTTSVGWGKVTNLMLNTASATPTANYVAEFDSTAHMNSTDMTETEVDDFVGSLDGQGESLDNFLDSRLNTLGGKNTGTVSLYNCSGTVSHNNLEFLVSEGGEIWVQGRININSYVRSGANSGVMITLPDIVPTPTKEFWSMIGFQSQHPREYVYISLTPNSRAAYIQTSESFNNTTNGTLTFICSGRVFVK